MLILGGPIGENAHRGPDQHPERPGRVRSVLDGLEDMRLGSDLVAVPVGPAPDAALALAHGSEYLDGVRAYAEEGGGQLDPDTFVRADSWATATLAAGAGLAVIDALRHHNDGIGLVLARPPGHHASRDRGMGFCLVNNIAVSAAALRAAGERVLIVDWDVHHGNGTQEIFWDDPGVLYVSTHQWPFYPGTGRPGEIGGPGAVGTNVNVPLPAGATGDVLRQAIADVAAPVIDSFGPDWVLVSCGFDAHRSDPLAELSLSSADFARLATDVQEFVPGPGRMALFLEGGYDAGALRRCTTSTLGALLGSRDLGPEATSEPATSGGPGTDHIAATVDIRRRATESARS